ncbi:hypothetical protein EB093_09105 [bacterium]|nr:hypothetical protein [bacterium]
MLFQIFVLLFSYNDIKTHLSGLIAMAFGYFFYFMNIFYIGFYRDFGWDLRQDSELYILLSWSFSWFGFLLQLLIYLFVGGKKLWRHYLNSIESHDQRQ